MDHTRAVTHSALWAAYGDALGFITERADTASLRRRIGPGPLKGLQTWKRLIGGKFGVTIELPRGTYSDDTQLRLATSRCIDGAGHFDVEAFAKVELPVWSSYSLGAGLGTKAAAAWLANPNANWFSNFFSTEKARYVEGGGNGAAMRVQPLVWAAGFRTTPDAWKLNVIRNAICTHGHPRGIAGAMMHATLLRHTLEFGDIPGEDQWRQAVREISEIPSLINKEHDLNVFWVPVWEQKAKDNLSTAFDKVRVECERDLKTIASIHCGSPAETYEAILREVGAHTPEHLGSAVKTSLAAAALSWTFRYDSPVDALLCAATCANSDTDTIATMAGAMLGAVCLDPPPTEVQDEEYIRNESKRLAAISCGNNVTAFQYPDLLSWQAPRTQLDVVTIDSNGALMVAGLGEATPVGERFCARSGGACWQWLRLPFGQTILAKQRPNLKASPRPRPRDERTTQGEKENPMNEIRQAQLFKPPPTGTPSSPNLDDLTTQAIRSGFDTAMIGGHILQLSALPNGIELAVAYASIVAKARKARVDAGKKSKGE